MLWLFSFQWWYNVSFTHPSVQGVLGSTQMRCWGPTFQGDQMLHAPHQLHICNCSILPGPCGPRCCAITGLKALRAAASRSFLLNSACFDSLQLVKQLDLVQACVEESSFHAWNCKYVLFFQAARSKRCLPVCII